MKKFKEEWKTIDLFPRTPDGTPESLPKLIWWHNSWAFVSWNSDAKKWLTDAGEAPFEDPVEPTEWAELPPPPMRALIELLDANGY